MLNEGSKCLKHKYMMVNLFVIVKGIFQNIYSFMGNYLSKPLHFNTCIHLAILHYNLSMFQFLWIYVFASCRTQWCRFHMFGISIIMFVLSSLHECVIFMVHGLPVNRTVYRAFSWGLAEYSFGHNLIKAMGGHCSQ